MGVSGKSSGKKKRNTLFLWQLRFKFASKEL